MSIEAFPLHWPVGWPRTERRQIARFKTTPGRARDDMLEELRRLGARQIVISTNIRVRQDGLPYANANYRVDDPGVAVYFRLNGRDQCIPCDRWNTVQDNMQAIRHTVAALRGIERWGTGRMVEATFQGFQALPGGQVAVRAWWQVLELENDSPTVDELVGAYRRLIREHHPDKGGSADRFREIVDAYNEGARAT